MNLLTQLLHLVGSGASAYILANGMRDAKTRPNLLAGFQMAESGAVPFLTALRDRAHAEGETWLAERLDRHANDEKRHGQIFAHALKQLNKKVIDFNRDRKPEPEKDLNSRPDESKRSPFFGGYFAGYSQEDLKPENISWEVFLASTYILELDASKDFVRMANALPEDSVNANIRKSILSVAQDETGHAAYLFEAMEQRFGSVKTQQLVQEWRDRKVNAMVAGVRNFIEKGSKMAEMVEEGAPIEMTESPAEQVAA